MSLTVAFLVTSVTFRMRGAIFGFIKFAPLLSTMTIFASTTRMSCVIMFVHFEGINYFIYQTVMIIIICRKEIEAVLSLITFLERKLLVVSTARLWWPCGQSGFRNEQMDTKSAHVSNTAGISGLYGVNSSMAMSRLRRSSKSSPSFPEINVILYIIRYSFILFFLLCLRSKRAPSSDWMHS